MIKRYSRQLALKGFGKKGQQRLSKSKVLIVGLGGLGGVSSNFLARAGVGSLRIIDFDKVEIGNLHRQILFDEKDINKSKALIAEQKLLRINNEIEIEALNQEFTEHNSNEIVKGVDIVLDGTDNLRTRFEINKACIKNEIPFIHAGAIMLDGVLTTIIPKQTPCFECIYSRFLKPKSSKELGIIGPTPGFMASLQSAEAIKYLTGIGGLLTNQLLLADLKNMRFDRVTIKKKPNCPVCGSNA